MILPMPSPELSDAHTPNPHEDADDLGAPLTMPERNDFQRALMQRMVGDTPEDGLAWVDGEYAVRFAEIVDATTARGAAIRTLIRTKPDDASAEVELLLREQLH